jgi:hypothetical protein
MKLHTMDIDLVKTIFHLVGLTVHGEVGMRKKHSSFFVCNSAADIYSDKRSTPFAVRKDVMC